MHACCCWVRRAATLEVLTVTDAFAGALKHHSRAVFSELCLHFLAWCMPPTLFACLCDAGASAGALKNFTGAVVAITHNQAFATALQPTHVLRVAGGSAKLSEHSGSLSSKDFEHSKPSSSSSSSNGNGNGKAAAGSNGNGKAASSSSSSAGKKVGAVEQRAWQKLCCVTGVL
jgi:hypothetical protein